MATVSFYQNVVVEDKEKIKEIRDKLNSNTQPCSETKTTATTEEEQRKIAKKWLSSLKR